MPGPDNGEMVPTRVERVYIEREPRIRPFLGDRDEEKVTAFVTEVKRSWRRIPETDVDARFDIIRDNLGPDVLVELDCQDPTDQSTPEKLLKLIIKVYGETRSPHQLLRVLLEQHQTPGEDIRAFSHRLKLDFDRLVRRQVQLELPEESDNTIREQFVLGVRDVHLRRVLREKIRSTPLTTFRALRDIAVSYADDTCGVTTAAAAAVSANSELLEAMKLLTTQNQLMQQRLEQFEEKLSLLQQPTQQRPALPDHRRQDQRRPRNGACYGCGERGHFRRDCPKARPHLK